LTSNHDWYPQIHVHRARVSSALHQKRDHSDFAPFGSDMKCSELMYASELQVGSGLYKLSTNSDMPIFSSHVQQRDRVTFTDSRQVHICAVAEQHCDALGRTFQGSVYQQRRPAFFNDAVDVHAILLDERSKHVGALR